MLRQELPGACEHIVTTYVVPNILHFVSFFLGIYHFRIQENEQMYALMEKVRNHETLVTVYLSRLARKQIMWVPNRFDSNQTVQAQKMATDWKFWI